jgi:RNA polymerase sigma-70 factor, ECF subfamily
MDVCEEIQMSSRISQVMFGIASSQTAGVFDAGVEEMPLAAPALGSLLPRQLQYKVLSDERLAGCLQNGDADALTVLFERHSPLLFAIARRILRNEAEAEDAVQQIFLDVFRSIQQFDSEKGEFKSWLLMFAYHRSFNRRRHLCATGFFSTDSLEDNLSEGVSGAVRSAGYLSIDASILIRQILGRLQPRQRRTIELTYYEGLTADEVAVRTGETVRVVRHNLYRGLQKLRGVLFIHSDVATTTPKKKVEQR